MDKDIGVLISLKTGRPIVPKKVPILPNKIPFFYKKKNIFWHVPGTYLYGIILEVPMLQMAQHNSLIIFCIFLIENGDCKFITEFEHIYQHHHTPDLTYTA